MSSPHSQLPDISGVTVGVLVGEKTFQVHHNVLVSSSKFFQNATKPEWRTDPTKPIDLADGDPVLFRAYVQWLYTKQALKKVTEHSFHDLAHLYVFGERIMDEAFKRVILLAIMDESNQDRPQPSLKSIRIIYAGTQAGDPARRLIVDISAFQISDPNAQRIQEADPSVDGDFMRDFLAALVKHRKQPNSSAPWVTHPEAYVPKSEKAKNNNLSSETVRDENTSWDSGDWGKVTEWYNC